MGTRGPVPKRTSQRHGHMSEADRDAVDKVPATGAVSVPAADKKWHPVARDWYVSLGESAQSRYYEPSDWQAARMVAFEISRMLSLEVPSPTMIKAIWSAMDALLTTEGSRRRVKIEIERAQASREVPDGVADFAKYADRLSG